MDTYRFVTNLLAGGRAWLFYQPVGLPPLTEAGTAKLPYLNVSKDEYYELQEAAPTGLYDSPFRITRDYGTHLDMEWT